MPKFEDILQNLFGNLLPGKKARSILVQPRGCDLADLKTLIETGKIRSIIDCTYPLSKLAEAHKYSESGHTVGKIAISVQSL